MTTEQFTGKIKELLAADDGIAAVIEKACIKAISTPYARDKFLNDANNDFILPKIVLSAVFTELAWQYAPINSNEKKLIKQIKPLVKVN